MPSWKDLGGALNTLREIDINAIRDESERPVFIACIGPVALFEDVAALLYSAGSRRYGPMGPNPLGHYPAPLDDSLQELSRADLLVLLLDGREALTARHTALFTQMENLALPLLVVTLYSDHPPAAPAGAGASFAAARMTTIADPEAQQAANILAAALLDSLPGELHLAAARRLPGLRPIVARNLVNTTSFANASYALASGLPEQIPVLSVPFAAADILVLTKNQALMVYKLALSHGAPPDFQKRIAEVMPVIGGAFLWRELARSLVGMIPIWGLVPKIAIAYAGTYTTGIAAWRWYADGELVSGAKLKQISKDATRQGRELAGRMIEQARAQGQETQGHVRNFFTALRRRLPSLGRKPRELPQQATPPPEVSD